VDPVYKGELEPGAKGEVAQVEEEAMPDTVVVVTDSAAGLAQMYQDLAPLAARLRSAALPLLFFSILFMGSLEGMFGLAAAMGILCCSAPGSLGLAYSARCARVNALIAATIALMHIFCLSGFALFILPDMPHAFRHVCADAHHDKMGMMPPHDHHALLGGDHGMMAGPHDHAAIAAPPTAAVDQGTYVVAMDVQVDGYELDGEMELPPSSATFVATMVSGAARRLQEVDLLHQDTPACARAERAFAQAAPSFILAAALIEFGLFLSAITVAKHSARLVLAARSYGANAI